MKKGQKPQLNRERIIEAGLKLSAEADVSAITFRKLAAELNVTPMAMYRHFDSKEELLAEMLDQFIRDAQVLPHQALPWQQWLNYVASHMFEVLREKPSWIPVFSTIQLRPSALDVMDNCLGVLLEAGFSEEQSVQAFLSMIHCMLGASLMFSSLKAEVSLAELENLQRHDAIEKVLPELIQQSSDGLPAMALLIAGLELQLQQNA